MSIKDTLGGMAFYYMVYYRADKHMEEWVKEHHVDLSAPVPLELKYMMEDEKNHYICELSSRNVKFTLEEQIRGWISSIGLWISRVKYDIEHNKVNEMTTGLKRTPLRRTPFKRKPLARQYEDSSRRRLHRMNYAPIHGNVYKIAREYAKRLASTSTEAEKRLMWEFRKRNINYLFQYPLFFRNEDWEVVRFYIADFFLPDRSLVIEVDGGYHGSVAQRELYRVKDAEIQSNYIKYKMVRLTNEQVFNEDSLREFMDKITTNNLQS